MSLYGGSPISRIRKEGPDRMNLGVGTETFNNKEASPIILIDGKAVVLFAINQVEYRRNTKCSRRMLNGTAFSAQRGNCVRAGAATTTAAAVTIGVFPKLL